MTSYEKFQTLSPKAQQEFRNLVKAENFATDGTVNQSNEDDWGTWFEVWHDGYLTCLSIVMEGKQ